MSVSVSVQNQSAIVPRNTSYQFNFTVTEPVSPISMTVVMTDGGVLGSGHLFTSAIDKTKWQTITSLVVA